MLFTWPRAAGPSQLMSTLPSQFVSGGQSVDASRRRRGPPSGRIFCGSGGSCDSGTSKNTSKKLFGAIGGTSKCPIGPKFGRNTPNSCELMSPLAGSVGLVALCILPVLVEADDVAVRRPVDVWSASAGGHRSRRPSSRCRSCCSRPQVNVTLEAAARARGHRSGRHLDPSRPSGRHRVRRGREVLVDERDAESPGTGPMIVHGIGAGQLLGRKWMYDGAPPAQVSRSP